MAGAVGGTRTANQFKGRIQYLSDRADDRLETTAKAIVKIINFLNSSTKGPNGETKLLIDLTAGVEVTDEDDILEIPSQKQIATALIKTVIFSLLTPSLIASCYTGGLTAFTLGHFALPRIVAIGSGLTAGATLGMTAVVVSALTPAPAPVPYSLRDHLLIQNE